MDSGERPADLPNSGELLGFAGALRVPFPWMASLSVAERETFGAEFIDLSRACAAAGQFDRLATAIHAWHSTAETYAAGVPRDGSDVEWLDEPRDPFGRSVT